LLTSDLKWPGVTDGCILSIWTMAELGYNGLRTYSIGLNLKSYCARFIYFSFIR